MADVCRVLLALRPAAARLDRAPAPHLPARRAATGARLCRAGLRLRRLFPHLPHVAWLYVRRGTGGARMAALAGPRSTGPLASLGRGQELRERFRAVERAQR